MLWKSRQWNAQGLTPLTTVKRRLILTIVSLLFMTSGVKSMVTVLNRPSTTTSEKICHNNRRITTRVSGRRKLLKCRWSVKNRHQFLTIRKSRTLKRPVWRRRLGNCGLASHIVRLPNGHVSNRASHNASKRCIPTPIIRSLQRRRSIRKDGYQVVTPKIPNIVRSTVCTVANHLTVPFLPVMVKQRTKLRPFVRMCRPTKTVGKWNKNYGWYRVDPVATHTVKCRATPLTPLVPSNPPPSKSKRV